MIAGQPLDMSRSYTVAITDFMYSGGDGYDMFANKPAVNTRLPLRELIIDTIRRKGVIDAKIDGRMVRIKKDAEMK
jgi:2',3'-cyclic-nucleotide 2'-phosphodiesterase (5'-nucleotidase family)